MKRILVCFVCFIVIMNGFCFIQPVKALKDFYMDIYPRKAGVSATYRFFVTLEKKVELYRYIQFGFPQGTQINPPIPTDPKEREERLKKINDQIAFLSPCPSCTDLPILDYYPDGSLKNLTFFSNAELDPKKDGFSQIGITIPEVCGFVTPVTPGWHTYRFSTHSEPNEVTSQFEIVESRIGLPEGVPEVKVELPLPAMTAKYVIYFTLGRGGHLKTLNGQFKIRFPEGTVLSKPGNDIKPSWITINGKPVTVKPSVQRLEIIFPTPVEVEDSGEVTIEFDKLCGIVNPAKGGNYQLEVSTTIDKEWVKSKEYTISEASSILKLSDYRTNRNAVYQLIYFQDKEPLKLGDTIEIHFPKEVQIIAQMSSHHNGITINGVSPLEVFFSGQDKSYFELFAGDIHVNVGDPVTIEFNCPEIKNPIMPCTIHLQYRPKGFQEYLTTPSVEIIPQKLEIIDVNIQPPNALEKADYRIKVMFGDHAFPVKQISVYLQHLDTVIDVVVENVINQEYEMVLTGVDNGKNPGTYLMKVTTDQEPQGAVYQYTILPPVPKTDLKIEGKKGNYQWFVEPPTVYLTSSDPSAEIWYWWDHGPKRIYSEGIQAGLSDTLPGSPLPSGQFKTRLYYQSVTPYGEEKPKTKEIWVDTVSPEVRIESPLEPTTITKERSVKISGRVVQINRVEYGENILILDQIIQVNGESITVNPDSGKFEYEMALNEGENVILIHAEDEAGNQWETARIVLLDSIIPAIILDERGVMDPYITGKTDPTALLQINGEIIPVGLDGFFRYELNHTGLFELVLTATDPVGNTNSKVMDVWYGYTIILQIGSLKASTNEENILLNVAPLIQKSKTLVPFRFIGEQLNATISYTTDPKTKLVKTVSYVLGNTTIVLTIGANKALVNGKSIPLDVPAQIMKGTTVVPLRFITENLNCKVEWEPKAQLITITYPNSA